MTSANLIRTAAGAELKRPSYSRNFITELGLRPFINARGTFTVLTGSLMEDEVLEAINFLAQQYVNIIDLQDKAGERIAEMLNCEAAIVTAGAASALTQGTAAAITGDDQDLIRELPNLPVTPSELTENLRNGHPSIETSGDSETLNINVSMMNSEEAGIVGRRIKEELERATA